MRNAQPEEASGLVHDYLRTLKRHRITILLCAAVGLLASLLLGLGALPVYRTRTSLDIRSLNGDFLNQRSVTATGNDEGGGDSNFQTQIKLLQSDTLLQQVSERMLAEPHPESVQRDDLFSRMMLALHLRRSEPLPYTKLLDDAIGRVKVKPIGMTRLVEITCDSYNADFSAQLCNTLTQTFEDQDLLTRGAEAQKTQEWLTRQVADVRQRAEDSQKNLAAAVGGDGLMLSQNTTLPGEERLRSLQEEYTKAQADRMKEEADADVASASPGNVGSVQDNPEHRAYALRLAELRGELAKLVPPLTEKDPKVIHVRSEMAEAQAGLQATQTASASRQTNDYAAARHREELLGIAMRSQQSAVSSDLQKASQVSLLRRELDSEQQLYQTLLQRAKEAGFATAMQAATIRVVDAARVPGAPFSPKRGISCAVGLALGSLAGLGFAFFKERNNTTFRSPGEVTRFLHVQELGVIPAAPRLTPDARRGMLQDGSSRAQGDAIALTRWADDYSIAAEAYRNATLSILLADASKRARSYIVSSPSAGEGKTTITSNLGIALSRSKLRVALIDGDLRRPALHRAFGVENDFGLRNILRGEVDLATVPTEVLTISTDQRNLSIVPAGRGRNGRRRGATALVLLRGFAGAAFPGLRCSADRYAAGAAHGRRTHSGGAQRRCHPGVSRGPHHTRPSIERARRAGARWRAPGGHDAQRLQPEARRHGLVLQVLLRVPGLA